MSFQPQVFEKRSNPKENRRKEIIKIKAKKLDNIKAVTMINKYPTWLFENKLIK